jgi:acetyltransferase-like isoleucine patch superfamily enzyme
MELRRARKLWALLWMQLSGTSLVGRSAARIAAAAYPPFYARVILSKLTSKGYISPKATIHHDGLRCGNNIYIDDRVLIYKDSRGGPVELGPAVHLHRDTTIQTGQGGSVVIGDETHVQPRCQFSAYKAPIHIGRRVEIAPFCAFYPYDHGIRGGLPVRRQPLESKGGIFIDDDVWIGVRATILDGVRIGKDAVIGAGSVVTMDIPDNAVAAGVPAKVVKMRSDGDPPITHPINADPT